MIEPDNNERRSFRSAAPSGPHRQAFPCEGRCPDNKAEPCDARLRGRETPCRFLQLNRYGLDQAERGQGAVEGGVAEVAEVGAVK